MADKRKTVLDYIMNGGVEGIYFEGRRSLFIGSESFIYQINSFERGFGSLKLGVNILARSSKTITSREETTLELNHLADTEITPEEAQRAKEGKLVYRTYTWSGVLKNKTEK